MISDDLFIDSNNLPSFLSKEESIDFLIKIKNGDMEARRIFIEHNIRLVLYEVTNRFYNAYDDLKDLVSVGVCGLIKAVDSFDLSKGFNFSTYAIRCIDNEILRFIKYNNLKNVDSLESSFCFNEDGTSFKLEDILTSNIDFLNDYLKGEMLVAIREFLNDLSERDKKIISMYYGFNCNVHSQYDIAKELGVSQNFISIKINRILKKIRIKLKELDFIDFYIEDNVGKKSKRNRTLKK